MQFIDVRDLAEWIVRALEDGLAGTYNATGDPTTLGAVLEACARAAGRDADMRWVDEALLVEAGVAPYTELPLWIPEGEDPYGRFGAMPNARAVAAGLTFRPLADTVARDARVGAHRSRRHAARASSRPAGSRPSARRSSSRRRRHEHRPARPLEHRRLA